MNNKKKKISKGISKEIKLKIVGAIILLIFCVAVVLYFTTDVFRTKRSVFMKYFDQTTSALELLEANTFKEYQQKKLITPYKRVGTATIITSSNVADTTVLDKLRFKIGERTDNKNDKSFVTVNVLSGVELIEEINLMREKDLYGFYCEDVANGYVFVQNTDMKRIAKCAGYEDVSNIPDSFTELNIEKILETTTIEDNHLNEVLKIIKNKVPTTAYNKDGKTKVEIDGQPYDATAYSLTLDATANANLMEEVFSKISTDSILMDYFTSKAKLLNMNDTYTDINSLNVYLQQKISEMKSNPQAAGTLKVIVYEHERNNIRTEISLGTNQIVIEHVIQENNVTYSAMTINEYKATIMYNNATGMYTYKIHKDKTATSDEFELAVDYKQTGSVVNNDIKNSMTINLLNGIKKLTIEYSDTVEFTNDIGSMTTVASTKHVIINEATDEEIASFITGLKKKINQVYINKGAKLGINLDPIFKE